jgi:hypothetical protein
VLKPEGRTMRTVAITVATGGVGRLRELLRLRRGTTATRQPHWSTEAGGLRVLTTWGLLLSTTAQTLGAPETLRPSPVAACNAWRVHISDLLDQHRIAQEITEDALSDMVRRFIAARNMCTPGRYELGLRMYEEIPLGPVQRKGHQ